MRHFRLIPAFKPRQHGIGYMFVAMVAWVAVGAVLMPWPRPAFADHSTVVPFSLVEQYQQLSKDDLREIFFGRRTRWPDGAPLRVFVLPDKSPVHIKFAKEILGVYPYQLRSAWDRMLYSGTGTPPVEVENLDEMKDQIEKTPGAIGYIEK